MASSSDDESRVDRPGRREGPGLPVKAARIRGSVRLLEAAPTASSKGDEPPDNRLRLLWPGTGVSIGMAPARVWWFRRGKTKRNAKSQSLGKITKKG